MASFSESTIVNSENERESSGAQIRIQGIDHVVLRCAHFDNTLRFYRDVLSCPLERSLDDVGLYQLRAGSGLIDLVPVGSPLGGDGEPRPEHHNVSHFCLEIDTPNWKRLIASLEREGIHAELPQRRYGATGFGPSIYIEDPEGNVVELKATSSTPEV